MLGTSDGVVLMAVGATLVVVALAVAAWWGNPVVEVADELSSVMPLDQVQALIDGALAVLPGAQVLAVLPGTRTLSYRHHPRYSVLLGILTLPIGLLVLLLVRETLQLTVSATAQEGSTRVLVAGRAHKKLAAALGDALRPLAAPRTLRP
jgi:hypothetical protein